MSAYAQLAGIPIVSGRVSFPRTGVWSGELRIEGTTPPSGRVSLQVGGSAFVGTVALATTWKGSSYVRVVAGAGGLAKELPAKGYVSSPIIVPLQDIATECGETLSKSVDAAVRNTYLAHWARSSGAGGTALARLVAAYAGAVWRFMPGGELWAGVETWPTVRGDVELLDFEPFGERLTFFAQNPGLLPGFKFMGRNVSYVEHTIKPERIETNVWFEPAEAA